MTVYFTNVLSYVNEWVPIVIASVALIVALIIPRRVFKRQVFTTLLSEYRTNEMGVAIKILYDFYHNDCKNDQTRIVDNYIGIFNKDNARCRSIDEWANTLHYQRRFVSQFYQKLANLYFYGSKNFLHKILKKSFSSFDLKIVQILYIIETEAMPIVLGRQPEKDIHISLNNMYDLFKESKGWKALTSNKRTFQLEGI